MTRWLVYRRSGESYRERGAYVARVDVDREPCLAVCAEGLTGCWHSQAWLEEDGEDRPMTKRTKPAYKVPTMRQDPPAEAERPDGRLDVHRCRRVVSRLPHGGVPDGVRVGVRRGRARDLRGELPRRPGSTRATSARSPATTSAPRPGSRRFDVLEGSPPCASFSVSGIRDEGWGQVRPYSDTKQRTDDLFDEWVRLVRELPAARGRGRERERARDGEGEGLLPPDHGRDPRGRLRRRRARPRCQWLGVPQRRQRVIILGYRAGPRAQADVPDAARSTATRSGTRSTRSARPRRPVSSTNTATAGRRDRGTASGRPGPDRDGRGHRRQQADERPRDGRGVGTREALRRPRRIRRHRGLRDRQGSAPAPTGPVL